MASCSLRNRAGAGGKASSFSRLFVSKVVTYFSQKTEIESLSAKSLNLLNRL